MEALCIRSFEMNKRAWECQEVPTTIQNTIKAIVIHTHENWLEMNIERHPETPGPSSVNTFEMYSRHVQ